MRKLTAIILAILATVLLSPCTACAENALPEGYVLITEKATQDFLRGSVRPTLPPGRMAIVMFRIKYDAKGFTIIPSNGLPQTWVAGAKGNIDDADPTKPWFGKKVWTAENIFNSPEEMIAVVSVDAPEISEKETCAALMRGVYGEEWNIALKMKGRPQDEITAAVVEKFSVLLSSLEPRVDYAKQ
jgi:hypothetical protein